MAQRDLLIIDTPTSVTVVVAICRALAEIYPTCVLRSDTGHVLHAVVEEGVVPEVDDEDEDEFEAAHDPEGNGIYVRGVGWYSTTDFNRFFRVTRRP